jgi:hypothetical protein
MSQLARLKDWTAPLVEAATRTRGHPAWLIVGIKAGVMIALLTVAAAWSMDRSAKAQMARLAENAAKGPEKQARQR